MTNATKTETTYTLNYPIYVDVKVKMEEGLSKVELLDRITKENIISADSDIPVSVLFDGLAWNDMDDVSAYDEKGDDLPVINN